MICPDCNAQVELSKAMSESATAVDSDAQGQHCDECGKSVSKAVRSEIRGGLRK